MLAFCPEPLNQGLQGTCVAHVFAQVLTSVLRLKYALHVPASSAVLVVKTACSGWEGAPVAALCEE